MWIELRWFVVLWAAMMCWLLGPATARADGPACAEPLTRWVGQCAEDSGLALRADACPPGMLIVKAEVGDAEPLRIELREPAGRALVTVDELGISPIGEFARWSEVSREYQDALTTVVDCAKRRPPPPLTSGPPSPRFAPDDDPRDGARSQPRAAMVHPRSYAPTPIPWLALVGLGCCAVASLRRRGPLRATERAVALALALLAALAQSRLGWSFFLQNAHGPEWVAFALFGESGLSTYGPGYAELLTFVARLDPARPERALAWAYLGLGVVLSTSLYVGARAVGARAALAAALALGLALDPTITRLIRSEAYHVPILALLFVAATTLVLAARRAAASSWWFVVGCVGAGLLISQAARVHPVGWLGALTLPTVILSVPGRARDRVAQLVIAFAIIAVAVGLTSGASLLETITTSMHASFTAERDAPRLVLLHAAALVAIIAAARRVAPARRRALLVLGALALSVSVARQFDPVIADYMRYRAGYFACFAPTVALGLAGLVTRARPRRRAQAIAACALALALALVAVATWSARTRVATDALESTWALEWRAGPWAAAGVVYVSGGDGMGSLALPLYTRDDVPAVGVRSERVDDAPLAGPLLYYRSSLCSGGRGRAACDALERRLELTRPPALERALPTIPSQLWNPLEGERVTVGLYRARPRERAAP
ncbi:MAG: hypothetical protein H6713_33565 [Myxococcales bacterium]|nr:hypothetical protein [Myxococcales bacterium]